jgi:hypothetical protein
MDRGCTVRIQTLIPICRKTKQYARPLSWKGQGRGVDLGQHLTKDGIKEVVIINANGAAIGANWNPSSEELMERWQLVTVETLWKERNHEPDDQGQTGDED